MIAKIVHTKKKDLYRAIIQITNNIIDVNTKGRPGSGTAKVLRMWTGAAKEQGVSEELLTWILPSPQRLCWNAASPVCSSPRRDCGSATASKRDGWLAGRDLRQTYPFSSPFHTVPKTIPSPPLTIKFPLISLALASRTLPDAPSSWTVS